MYKGEKGRFQTLLHLNSLENFKLILNFCFIPPHSDIALCEKHFISEWGTEKELFPMTSENATATRCLCRQLKTTQFEGCYLKSWWISKFVLALTFLT